jgi:hypothetical protein
MLTTLFAALLLPPPNLPYQYHARVIPTPLGDPTVLVLQVGASWHNPRPPVRREWRLTQLADKAPKEVLLLEYSVHILPDDRPWLGLRWDNSGFVVNSYVPNTYREVWLRDAWGRNLTKIPIKGQ